jgi:hypothetical protein
MTLLIPVVGTIVLLLYFVVEVSSSDPWGRKKSD